MVQLNRYAQSTPPQFAAATVFCMWDRTTNLIEGANFQMNRFRGFGAPGAEIDPPIDLAHRPYNVLHCENCAHKPLYTGWSRENRTNFNAL